MASVNIFVLGLDDKNLEILRGLPGAADYHYLSLLSRDELQFSDTPVSGLLHKAERQLEAFRGSIDAIVGYWDFPVSMMVPILCRRFGLRSSSLEAVVKCEHKYWSRLEQQKVIVEYPRFALLDPAGPVRPPEGLRYPMWVKPVKSYASQLAFRAEDDAQLAAALAEIREGIDRIGKPFEYILRQLDLPPEIAEAGGRTCLVEEELSGTRATAEGYSSDGRIDIYGVVDSLTYPGTPSFLRYQYPSALPPHILRRMEDLSKRVITQIGLDNSTFCIEFFCRPERTGSGEITLLEVNPRHSQSHAELFREVDGVPNHHCMISLALGKDPRLPRRQGPYALAAKCFLRRFHDGRVLHRAGAEEIDRIRREIPGVDVVPVVDEGMRLSQVPQAHDSYSYELAHVYVAAFDERELQHKYDRCVAALDFRFEEEGALCAR
ncbi:acetyl-CoA carboxylase biotin carboxylase subunit family protein [Streptomyces sp. TRM68367]|uniref:ATP-grasp domain-containing protein n=1 Tax=Streptomyces sp. TRM68367 TaxID=2758415 RepID=UPI00165B17E2|nr:ATP-grasp domain-containing protein [Streptomyces sp. TRM68367]MBC9726261.1 ATP-grasp domain-containing protein [Streptomyces sp. TRM68367]